MNEQVMEDTRRAQTHKDEMEAGKRFAFGENWAKFLDSLDEERIGEAVRSLREMLEVETLAGRTFLDVGSGSGLFSLAARRLGAQVHSFDYDPKSVWCTRELKQRYFPADPNWVVEEGSVLDADYLKRLSRFDVVYSWGVLHHTGAMWDALNNVDSKVLSGGKLFVALYNDQGTASRIWKAIKAAYVASPVPVRWLIVLLCTIRLWGPATIKDLLVGRPFRTWSAYKKERGMTPVRAIVDWVGGYPFEVCSPEKVFEFYKGRNYALEKLRTCGGGLGCNEFVFRKR